MTSQQTLPHRLIIGRSLSGKSGLAKQIGSRLRLQGFPVLAYNPTKEKGYTREDAYGCVAADWESADPYEFVEKVVEIRKSQKYKGKPIFLVVDEAHSFFERSGTARALLGTEGRHYGLNIIAVTQKGQLINPTFRSQCHTIYLFACSLTDAKFMADEFGNKDLMQAPKLPQGKYFKLTFDKIEESALF